MKKYTIWATIEEYNDKTQEYKDLDDIVYMGKFKSLKKARRQLELLRLMYEYY